MRRIIIKSSGLIQTLNRKGPVVVPMKLKDSVIRKILAEGGHSDSVYEISDKGVKSKITTTILMSKPEVKKEETKQPEPKKEETKKPEPKKEEPKQQSNNNKKKDNQYKGKK